MKESDWLEALRTRGFAVWPEFFSPLECDVVARDIASHAGALLPAAVGKGRERQIDASMRRDSVFWLEGGASDASAAQKLLWTKVKAVQSILNQELLLGLWDFEGHYAVYPAGGFYKRHRDVFRQASSGTASQNPRAVSWVSYFNASWRPGDGGELRIYTREGSFQDVEPRAGTLVCFLSDEFEHEVLPCRIERKSFTGWFRRRVSSF